jgi:H+/Cl- antiporter ClcA
MSGSVDQPSPGSVEPPPFTQTREFWLQLAYAVGLGVSGALVGLVFLGVIDFGGGWYDDDEVGWFDGELWWVAVTVGAGLVVGLLHKLTGLPDRTAGLIADLQDQHVDASKVPGIVVVSAASLMGGASLGPEKALGSVGGGLGGWVSERRGLGDEMGRANTLDGFSGAFGGLLSSPLVVVMLVLEVARPTGERFGRALMGGVVASSVSFGLYFAIAGSVFLDAYEVPQYKFESWHLLAGIALGVVAAALVAVLGAVIAVASGLFARLTVVPSTARSMLGGLVFGLVGVALPLTLFTGTDQLGTVLDDAGKLGTGLLVALVFAKMVTFAVSTASGFVGGAIFPALFIGGSAGVAAHEIVPDLPLALAFTCLLAAVPGALVSAPFTMVLLVALLTQVGALQTAPVLLAVVTAFLVTTGVKYYASRRRSSPASPG